MIEPCDKGETSQINGTWISQVLVAEFCGTIFSGPHTGKKEEALDSRSFPLQRFFFLKNKHRPGSDLTK